MGPRTTPAIQVLLFGVDSDTDARSVDSGSLELELEEATLVKEVAKLEDGGTADVEPMLLSV